MQTKKKISARHSREHASPRVCRPQKKVLETVQVAETKVKASELITSSARKQKTGGFSPKHAVVSKNVNNKHILTIDEHDACLGSDTVNGAIFDHKVCNEGSDERSAGTIFSPSFHISKDAGDNIENAVDFIKFFRKEDEKICNDGGNQKAQDPDAVPTRCSSEMDIDSAVSSDSDMSKYGDQGSDLTVDRFGANLSSEVSAIYLAMQQSKLECVDEQSPTCMSTDVPVEDDDCEDLDYFDPFLFIKNLPVLAEVVPTFRPSLLPKQTRSCPRTSLVLDLDETLVHSSLEPCEDADFTFPVTFNLMQHTVYVRCRPHLMDFMERVASLFEIIIFTASQSIYAEQLLNVLDPKRKIFRHRIYRDSCVFVEGNYLKDLSILGRDLAHVIIVDNSPQAFGFQVENGIPIESWFDDRSDKELLLLLPFLETLNKAEDVRPLIAEKFNLREKVAAAVYPSLNSFGR